VGKAREAEVRQPDTEQKRSEGEVGKAREAEESQPFC